MAAAFLHLSTASFSGIHHLFSDLRDFVTYETHEHPPERRHILPRMGDLCSPIAIDLPDTNDSNDSLCIEIGTQRLLQVPLSILALTGRKIGTLQTFDLSAFFPEIELIRLSYHQVHIFLTSNLPFGLHVQYTQLDHDKKHTLVTTEGKHSFQQIATYRWASDSPQHTITPTIAFNNFSKGYIIESPDITQLRRLKLRLNGHDRWNYGPGLLASAAHRLSPQHLWVPFNPTLPPTPFNRTATSFVGGLQQSRIDIISFHLEFTEPQTSVKIHSFDLNLIRLLSGFAQAKIEHIHEIIPPPPPSVIIDRPLPASRATEPCPITYEPFNPGDNYGECAQCHHCYHVAALQQALLVTHGCPICRTPWPVTTQLYRVPETTAETTTTTLLS